MLHVEPSTAQTRALPAHDPDVQCAKRWIAGARECGLIVTPWDHRSVLQAGQQDDGPNDFTSCLDRFVEHPDFDAVKGCRKGVVFETLCVEFGIDPDDPNLCEKVTARMAPEVRS